MSHEEAWLYVLMEFTNHLRHYPKLVTIRECRDVTDGVSGTHLFIVTRLRSNQTFCFFTSPMQLSRSAEVVLPCRAVVTMVTAHLFTREARRGGQGGLRERIPARRGDALT